MKILTMFAIMLPVQFGCMIALKSIDPDGAFINTIITFAAGVIYMLCLDYRYKNK